MMSERCDDGTSNTDVLKDDFMMCTCGVSMQVNDTYTIRNL